MEQGQERKTAGRQRSPRCDKRDYNRPPTSLTVPDDGRLATDRIAVGLEASSRLSAEIGHPGPDIRPCIATLIESSLSKGDFPNRNEGALITASEFRRIGFDYESTYARVERWNEDNRPPLRPSELRKAVNNAFAKDYKYGCRNRVLVWLCIGQETCPFRNTACAKKTTYNDLVFLDYGWPSLLSNRQVLIYQVALPYLEKTRKICRGGLICANHMQIAEACGIARERIGADLQVLTDVGLIEYEVGRRLKWEGIASRIRRVFPIPRPTRQVAQLLKRVTKHPPVKSKFVTI